MNRKASQPVIESGVVGRIVPKRNFSPAARSYTPRRSPSVTQWSPSKIQNAILELFDKYDYQSIDLDALIFFVMQRFDVSVDTYENLYRVVRRHILSNFPATAGKHILLQEVSMRRMVIDCTSTGDRGI
jgi:hypothetical protein